MSQKQLGLLGTGAAGVFSFRFVLAATTRLVAQILEIHLHLLTGLLDRCLRYRHQRQTGVKSFYIVLVFTNYYYYK